MRAAAGSVAFTETHTIRVFDGTFAAPPLMRAELLPTAVNRLIYEAAPGTQPVISGGFYLGNGCRYVTIDGFVINPGSGGNAIYITESSNDHIIKNCKLANGFSGVRALARSTGFPRPWILPSMTASSPIIPTTPFTPGRWISPPRRDGY